MADQWYINKFTDEGKSLNPEKAINNWRGIPLGAVSDYSDWFVNHVRFLEDFGRGLSQLQSIFLLEPDYKPSTGSGSVFSAGQNVYHASHWFKSTFGETNAKNSGAKDQLKTLAWHSGVLNISLTKLVEDPTVNSKSKNGDIKRMKQRFATISGALPENAGYRAQLNSFKALGDNDELKKLATVVQSTANVLISGWLLFIEFGFCLRCYSRIRGMTYCLFVSCAFRRSQAYLISVICPLVRID